MWITTLNLEFKVLKFIIIKSVISIQIFILKVVQSDFPQIGQILHIFLILELQ